MDEMPMEVPPPPPNLDDLPGLDPRGSVLRSLAIVVASVGVVLGCAWIWQMRTRAVAPLPAGAEFQASALPSPGSDGAESAAESGLSGGENGERAAAPERERGLEVIWSFGSLCSGVAADSARGVLYVAESGECVQCDAEGEMLSAFGLSGQVPALRVGNLDADAAMEVLEFDYFRSAVHAWDDDGAALWSYEVAGSVNEVWLADLDRDGRCEALLGWSVYGASPMSQEGGAAALDPDGEVIWEDASLGPVPFVSAGDVNGDGRVEVLAQGRQGVALFDAKGLRLETYHPFAITQMAFALGPGAPRGPVSWVAASAPAPSGVIRGHDHAGEAVWETSLRVNEVVGTGPVQAARTRAWAFVPSAYPGGIVLDLTTGAILARDNVPGTPGESVWFEPSGAREPLLALVAGSVLRLVRIHPLSPEEAAALEGARADASGAANTTPVPGAWGGAGGTGMGLGQPPRPGGTGMGPGQPPPPGGTTIGPMGGSMGYGPGSPAPEAAKATP